MNALTGLFGRFGLSALGLVIGSGVPQSPAGLPDSGLPITLVGVAVHSTDPSKSICLVKCSNPADGRGMAMLGPGDVACAAAEIRDVHQNAVVIRSLKTNRLELLTFRTVSTSLVAQTPEPEPAPEPPDARASSAVASVGVPKPAVNVSLLNLPDLLSSALATPHYRDAGDGQRVMDGFEIGSITPGGPVDQLGFRNGDVILEVNGQPLDGMASAMSLLGQAQLVAQAKVVVSRHGERLMFVFNTK